MNLDKAREMITSGEIKPDTRYELDVNLSGFGLGALRMEGCAVHPDEIEADLSDEQYYKQLKAYYRDVGDSAFKTFCVRDNLLQKLKEESK